jgi:AcrR family transcriptional regulator
MSEQLSKEKRTQAERRSETRALLLASACSLFGERGYVATSLEDIAQDCKLTIRPIYYHFGSKRALFAAANELMEQRALRALDCSSSIDAWESLLALCTDPAFRRIILEDAPNALGRDRWAVVRTLPWSSSLSVDDSNQESPGRIPRVIGDRAALAILMEAALYIVECGNELAVRCEAMRLISVLLPEQMHDTAARTHALAESPYQLGA